MGDNIPDENTIVESINAVNIRRTEDSEEEPAIAIDEGHRGFIDRHGKFVKEVWEFNDRSDFFISTPFLAE